MKKYIHSRLLRWLLSVGLLIISLMTIARAAFVLWFKPVQLSWADMADAFVMGLRYDLRIVGIVLFVLLIIGSFKKLNPFNSLLSKKVMFFVLEFFMIITSFVYAIDFAHYAYLSNRLNASVLNFLEDGKTSLGMVWETYPVIRIILSLIVIVLVFKWGVKKLFNKAALSGQESKKGNRVVWVSGSLVLFAVMIFGRVGQYPLRWSDAFSLGNEFKSNTAFNPYQSFFSTLTFRKSTYDLKKVKEFYPMMAAHLQVTNPDLETMNFERVIEGDSVNGNTPNVVIVIVESFSGYKSSMWGNPLNTTPYFKNLCDSGVFFNRCFPPTFGTARGVWATLTGLPDIEIARTASRNPAMVNQHILANELTGYDKMYFIGGSTSWANIRGILGNNIDGIKIYEEDNIEADRIDVWGISDKDLLLTANKKFSEQKKPFFSVIQTADNHRPYTIPEVDLDKFKKLNFPLDSLKKYGFESNEEMNAFRYTDFCIQQFIEAAKKETYFKNTVFAFVGDHGINGDARDMFPRSWSEGQPLSIQHVPLLFYAPGLLKPELRTNICSQIDVMPTIIGISGVKHRNGSLGRNLLNTNIFKDQTSLYNNAFIINADLRQIGLVTNEHLYTLSMKTGTEKMVSIINNDPVANSDKENAVLDYSRKMTNAYFETAKYLSFNNKKKATAK
jgi:phosphoglycerol transferase MdoB-like AlkP superfamily enzyme